MNAYFSFTDFLRSGIRSRGHILRFELRSCVHWGVFAHYYHHIWLYARCFSATDCTAICGVRDCDGVILSYLRQDSEQRHPYGGVDLHWRHWVFVWYFSQSRRRCDTDLLVSPGFYLQSPTCVYAILPHSASRAVHTRL